MKFLLKIFALFVAILLMGGCSSSSDGNSDSSVTGYFVDDPVAGLTYECSSGTSGVTGTSGEYTCEQGDNVSFSIGDVPIGTVTAQAGIVTPYSFFPNNQEAALNLARLLQSLDSDPSDNIITFDSNLLALLDAGIDFTSPTFVVDVENDLSIVLVSVQDAQTQLNETIVSAGGDIPDGANIPIADAGATQNVHNNDVVTLDGSASSDADGDTLTYAWTITSKPVTSGATLSNATVVNPTFTADESGSYVVELVVNDGSVNSVPDEVTIIATTANAAPVAVAGIDQNVNTTDIVSLDGSGSTDADILDTLTYSWSITDKPATSIATLSDTTAEEPTFEADLEGTYEIQLIVNDGTVDSAPDTIVVTATTITNSVPVAEAGDNQSVTTGDSVTLDGSGSTDADFDSLTYDWGMTSRPNGSSATLSSETAEEPTFTADIEGSYVVSLVVNDGTVNSVIDTVTITAVTSTPPPLVYGTVTSYAGRVWHDRNLGATQVCTSMDDEACFGDYYQWGRNADGHQVLISTITPIQAPDVTDVGHGDFITSTAGQAQASDWGHDADLDGVIRQGNWSSTAGNSVCPAGFRLPTKQELQNEINAGILNNFDAFLSPLKLPSAGGRYSDTGDIYGQGTFGYLWSSEIDDGGTGFYIYSPSMYYAGDAGVTNDVARGGGIAVRCIQQQ